MSYPSHSNSGHIPESEKAAPVSENFSGTGSPASIGSGIPPGSQVGHTIIGRPVPSPRALARFKELYRQHRGVDLPDDEALDLATRYLQLFVFGITPPPGKNQSSGNITKSP